VKKFLPLQAMIEVGIFAGLAMLLDLLPSIKPIPSISISFAMVPIFIVAFRWGVKSGFISGLIWGILQVITGDAWMVTPVQTIIEYFIAFNCIGFAGLLAPAAQKAATSRNRGPLILAMTIGIFIGSLARYVWHFLAGIIFFANYAHEAGKAPIVFSFVTNGISMVTNFIICSVILSIIMTIRPELLTNNKPKNPIQKAA